MNIKAKKTGKKLIIITIILFIIVVILVRYIIYERFICKTCTMENVTNVIETKNVISTNQSTTNNTNEITNSKTENSIKLDLKSEQIEKLFGFVKNKESIDTIYYNVENNKKVDNEFRIMLTTVNLKENKELWNFVGDEITRDTYGTGYKSKLKNIESFNKKYKEIFGNTAVSEGKANIRHEFTEIGLSGAYYDVNNLYAYEGFGGGMGDPFIDQVLVSAEQIGNKIEIISDIFFVNVIPSKTNIDDGTYIIYDNYNLNTKKYGNEISRIEKLGNYTDKFINSIDKTKFEKSYKYIFEKDENSSNYILTETEKVK